MLTKAGAAFFVEERCCHDDDDDVDDDFFPCFLCKLSLSTLSLYCDC